MTQSYLGERGIKKEREKEEKDFNSRFEQDVGAQSLKNDSSQAISAHIGLQKQVQVSFLYLISTV